MGVLGRRGGELVRQNNAQREDGPRLRLPFSCSSGADVHGNSYTAYDIIRIMYCYPFSGLALLSWSLRWLSMSFCDGVGSNTGWEWYLREVMETTLSQQSLDFL